MQPETGSLPQISRTGRVGDLLSPEQHLTSVRSEIGPGNLASGILLPDWPPFQFRTDRDAS